MIYATIRKIKSHQETRQRGDGGLGSHSKIMSSYTVKQSRGYFEGQQISTSHVRSILSVPCLIINLYIED
jgi:hypothetical protein